MLAEVVDRGERDVDDGLVAVVAHLGHPAGVGERVPGVHRHAEPDREPADPRVGAGPVGEEPAAVAGVREDVHEDVRCALRLRVLAVVVHGHEVARRDRTRDDHRRGHVDHERRELVADLHGRRVDAHDAHDPEHRQRQITLEVLVHHLDRRAHDVVGRLDADQVRDEPPALLELDEDDDRDPSRTTGTAGGASRPPTGSSPAPTTRSRSTPASGTAGTSAAAGGAARRTRRSAGRGGGVRAGRPRRTGCRATSTARAASAGSRSAPAERPLGSNFRMRNVWRPTRSPAASV